MLELLTSQTINQNTKSTLWKFIDAIYPPSCCNCGVIGAEICAKCKGQIRIIPLEKACNKCGNLLDVKHKCDNEKFHTVYQFQQSRSWGFYDGPLKIALRKIKYERGFGLIKYFIDPIANYIKEWGIGFDFLVPVPLGVQRKEERGYNQAEILARPVARLIEKPLFPGALTRIKETRSQVGLNHQQRKENVSDAFTANKEICNKNNILLFDDITTTFSTLNACASALMLAGAKSVFCFTVARTIFQLEKEKK